MTGRWPITIGAALVGLCLTCLGSAQAQENEARWPTPDEPHSEDYYDHPAYRPDPRAIIHQKARARAAQRHARLASLSWYGMSNARPTAAPTPFTSLYSPMWQMPGNQPFTWYPAGSQPTYLLYIR